MSRWPRACEKKRERCSRDSHRVSNPLEPRGKSDLSQMDDSRYRKITTVQDAPFVKNYNSTLQKNASNRKILRQTAKNALAAGFRASATAWRLNRTHLGRPCRLWSVGGRRPRSARLTGSGRSLNMGAISRQVLDRRLCAGASAPQALTSKGVI